MAMLAEVELDDAFMTTENSDPYQVTSPHARSRNEILRTQSKAIKAHELDLQTSDFLRNATSNAILAGYREKLERLSHDPASVLGDDAEAPSPKSMFIALNVLKYLLSRSLRPENVSLAADGGIAIRFKPEPSKRTYLEVLNDGGQHLLQYDAGGRVSIQSLTDLPPARLAERAIQLLRSIERVPLRARAD